MATRRVREMKPIRRSAAAIGVAALVLTATGCGAFGLGEVGPPTAAELEQQVKALADELEATEIVGLRVSLSAGTQSTVLLVTPEGIVGKSLETGEDTYTEPLAPAPYGTSSIAEFPYAEAVEIANSDDLGCGDGVSAVYVETQLQLTGALAAMSVCEGAKDGGSWLGGERLPVIEDPFSAEGVAQIVSEARVAGGDKLVEIKLTGVNGPLGGLGAGGSFVAPQGEFFGMTCFPSYQRPLGADDEMYLRAACNDALDFGETYAIDDFPVEDMVGAIEFGKESFDLQSNEAISSVEFFVEDGERKMLILGAEQGVMGTVLLDA